MEEPVSLLDMLLTFGIILLFYMIYSTIMWQKAKKYIRNIEREYRCNMYWLKSYIKETKNLKLIDYINENFELTTYNKIVNSNKDGNQQFIDQIKENNIKVEHIPSKIEKWM